MGRNKEIRKRPHQSQLPVKFQTSKPTGNFRYNAEQQHKSIEVHPRKQLRILPYIRKFQLLRLIFSDMPPPFT